MKLEVGKTYRSADGCEYTITSEREPNVFHDGMGHEWSEDGAFYSCYEEGNPSYDLVEEVKHLEVADELITLLEEAQQWNWIDWHESSTEERKCIPDLALLEEKIATTIATYREAKEKNQ